MAASAQDLTAHIDALLERYLQLLDQYSTLRASLATAQAAIHQHIARANFTADRGRRYGQDDYDERMQAVRRCQVTSVEDANVGTGSIPHFRVVLADVAVNIDTPATPSPDRESPKKAENEQSRDAQARSAAHRGEQSIDAAVLPSTAPKSPNRDPIRMFGVLAPIALRQAQAQAIPAVAELMPRLLSLDAEMRAVEIAVGRARKQRAKATRAIATKKAAAAEGATVEADSATAATATVV